MSLIPASAAQVELFEILSIARKALEARNSKRWNNPDTIEIAVKEHDVWCEALWDKLERLVKTNPNAEEPPSQEHNNAKMAEIKGRLDYIIEELTAVSNKL